MAGNLQGLTRAPWAVAAEEGGAAAPSALTPAVQGLMLAEARRAAAEASAGPLSKRINDQRSMQRWKQSTAHRELLRYISDLGDSVVGRRISEECEERPIVATLVAEFAAMSAWIDEIPPIQQSMRYGNKAFKTWHQRLAERSPALMEELLERHGPAHVEDAAVVAAELNAYFVDSFGSAVRIDYGTGHELALIAWFYCLEKVGLLVPSDRAALVLRVFQGYLTLMQRLQTTYWLEPAGSHGVWGLDDYQFLCFIFGAAQLVDHELITPNSIHDEEVLEKERATTCTSRQSHSSER